MYEGLRARYAAERAAYHRGIWPERNPWMMVERDANLVGERVELISGNRVGTVIDAAHATNGDVEALLVRLDNDKVVWIDSRRCSLQPCRWRGDDQSGFAATCATWRTNGSRRITADWQEVRDFPRAPFLNFCQK